MPNYKFREDALIAEFSAYIDQTYDGHYGQGGLQSSEVIVDRGHGIGFFLGNVDKYNGRYGKKGEPADHRKDIVKIIHYGFLALYEHDRIHEVPAPPEETMSEDDFNYIVPGPTNLDEYTLSFDFPRGDSIESKLSFEDIEWLNEASVGNEFPNKERSLNDITPKEWDEAAAKAGKAFLEKELAK
jgi:hypothetical protein